jgi:hypothetical protein
MYRSPSKAVASAEKENMNDSPMNSPTTKYMRSVNQTYEGLGKLSNMKRKHYSFTHFFLCSQALKYQIDCPSCSS